MNKSKHTGTKLSEYPTGLTNKRYKLLYNHYFMSYAPVNFGISTVNKNYKIPIQALRNDIKYYIGLENAKGDWQNMIHFWSGNWFNENDKTKSYIYDWKYEERGSSDYISNKFGNKTDNEGNAIDDYDRIFFIKDAPIPLEEKEHKDPNPTSNKFVNKKYIDDRFNGIRKVTVDDTKLEIRPYPCVYEYSVMPSSINIVDTLTLEDGRTIKDCIENNCLIFYIKLPTPTSTTLSVKANKVDTKWGFSGELTQLLSTAKNNEDNGLIKCYAEYINGTFTVHCTNGMNLKPGEGGTVTIDTTDTIVDGSDAVPTSNAVYDYVKSQEDKNIHVLEEHLLDNNAHITNAERIFWNNKVNSVTGDTYIKKSGTADVSLSLNVADEYNDIIDEIDDENTNRKTIPNSRTVWEFADISKYFFPYLEHDERKDYILYDTVGNPMYISFIHKLTDGSNMFYGKEQFISVYLDFPELTNGENMFANCLHLENFGTETLNIEKLNNGTNMFNNCSLNATSVDYILEALKNTITTNTGCVMNLTVSANQKESVIILLNEQYNTNTPTDDLTQITSSAISLTNKNGGTWDITITYKQ